MSAYLYDGTFDGLLTCIFESYFAHEIPDAIEADAPSRQLSLFGEKRIRTDEEKARRVKTGVEAKISRQALSLIMHVFLSCAEQKEMMILQFVRLGMMQGHNVLKKLSHPLVSPLIKAQRNVRNEAHLLKEFLRFSDHSGVLMAKIDPKNMVLPLMAEHFAVRLRNERFLIHDQTHAMTLIYADGVSRIVDSIEFPWESPSEEEQGFRSLWKLYYDTIAVEGRENLKLRMSHMPKRFWDNMTEFLDQDS